MSVLEFASLGAFATHLANAMVPAVESHLSHGLHAVTERIERTAKAKLGEYQPQSGPFGAWAELTDFTKEDRIAKGFDPDQPLLRTGELRDSIEHEVHGNEAVVGSTSDIAVYQELGTEKMPPRPFLGPALFENEEELRGIWHDVLMRGFLGSGVASSTRMNSKRLTD